jgi:ribosomal protein S18 acetylase RimI-like enzyme
LLDFDRHQYHNAGDLLPTKRSFTMQAVKYYKRYRMELDLRAFHPIIELPPGFSWLAWDRAYLASHARVKCRAFQGELDAEVFPALAHEAGCLELMTVIANQSGFCPAATWLVYGPFGPVGTVQGLFDNNRCGGIQNLGVIPEYRGLGLGRALLLRALKGFTAMGARRAFLEVTAKNSLAVNLYRRIGFRCCQTLYRGVAVDTASLTLSSVGVGV